jgi:hypothetical protein
MKGIPVSAFSKEQVARAMAAVPETASKTLKLWLERAQEQGLTALGAACDAELAARGTLDLDADAARRHSEWAAQSADLTLQDAILAAFTAVPANEEEERPIVRMIGEAPGISNAQLEKAFGKRHTGLVLGHLIHHRHGFFRHLLPEVEGKPQSNLLLERDDSGKSVCYRFRPEATAVFRDLGLIG